jgi:hypothetical protein
MSDPWLSLSDMNIVLVILVAWCVPWIVYNQFIRTPEFNFMGTVVIELPMWFKCAIPYVSPNPEKNICANTNFDMWTVGHILIYFTLGLCVPRKYLLILVISILCEVYEYVAGWRARWVLDPIPIVFGYVMGSLLANHVSSSLRNTMDNYSVTIVSLLSMFALLYFNKPAKTQS